MTAVSIIGIFLGLAVLIFCSMKGLSVFISALLASVVIALTGGISLESALLTDFMTGFVNFITGNFMVFAAGALMGKAYEITGGAKAVARLFIKLFTVRFAPYAIFLAIVVMTWGGIAGFVLAFSVFPIAVEIFREADLPRSMIPGIVIAGCCTISSWGPGSAQPVNNIYATNFQTSLMGAPVPSIIMAVASLLVTCLLLAVFIGRARARGKGFVATKWDVPESDAALPNGILALIPLVVALVTINVKVNGKAILPTAFGIFVGAVVAILLMFRHKSDDKALVAHIGDAFQNALTSIGNTAAMAAVGTVAQSVVGFSFLLNALVGMGGNPLISAAGCAGLICGVTGGATGGTSLIGPTLAGIYGDMGLNLSMVGRIVNATGHVTGTLPNCGFINTTITGIAHDTYSACYKYSFAFCTLANLCAVIVGIIVMSIMGFYI